MIIIGLTGSIGMGKSTTAAMFREEGVPVHDADAAVHELYTGRAVPLVEAAFPDAIRDGIVDRRRLSEIVVNDPQAMKRLEAIVHPLVREAEREFVELHRKQRRPLVVLDIPLLFETGAEKRVNRIVVVTASEEEQRRRVLSRPDMTEEKFHAILSRQVPDAEKRRRADFIIDTGRGMENARSEVRRIIRCLTEEQDSGHA